MFNWYESGEGAKLCEADHPEWLSTVLDDVPAWLDSNGKRLVTDNVYLVESDVEQPAGPPISQVLVALAFCLFGVLLWKGL